MESVIALTPSSVLEVGCGDGCFIGALGDRIANRVGADFSERAIGFARAFYPDVKFYAGDIGNISQAFDVVVAIEVLEHIPDNEVQVFLETLFARTLPGGHLLISVPSTVVPVNKKHYRHYSSDLLLKQVQAAQKDVEIVSLEHLCRVPLWMRLYDKLTINRYWTMEIKSISSWIWRIMWSRYRIAHYDAGRHVVGLFKKPY